MEKNKNTTGFFEERRGVKSWIRLMSTVIIITSLAWGSCEIIAHCIVPNFQIHTELILGTLAVGIGGKVWQKRYEKAPTDESSEST